jgi:hypothetical protein
MKTMSDQHISVLDVLSYGDWLTAAHIAWVTGVSPTQMRALCQEHPGSYISSTRGYKRSDRATNDEIAECIDDLVGRATAILQRVSVLSRRQKYLARPAKKVAA